MADGTQKRKLKSPPNYLSRRFQYRLLGMVGSLLLILFLIAGGTGLGVLAAVLGGVWRITDTRHRLRLDRLADARD